MMHLTNPATGADVWTASLCQPLAQAGIFESLLSSEELSRAERLRVEHVRASFILNRAYLRCILAEYLGIPPWQIPLAAGPSGKPLIPQSELRFNVSHSSGLFACIVAAGREVGIDIERVRSIPEMAGIAQHFFAPAELESWYRLPDDERPIGFFRCWTRKEAFLKATGEGLGRALDSFAVSLGDCAGNCLVAPPEEASRWHVQPFEPVEGVEGCVGAIAAAGDRPAIRLLRSDPERMATLARAYRPTAW